MCLVIRCLGNDTAEFHMISQTFDHRSFFFSIEQLLICKKIVFNVAVVPILLESMDQ